VSCPTPKIQRSYPTLSDPRSVHTRELTVHSARSGAGPRRFRARDNSAISHASPTGDGTVALSHRPLWRRQCGSAPIPRSSCSRRSEHCVRRVPFPVRDHRLGGALVLAVRAVLPRRRGAPGQAWDRGRPRHRLGADAAFDAAACRRCPARSGHGWRALVRRRDRRQGRGPVALRLPGGRPARPDHRRLRLTQTRHPSSAPVLHVRATRRWRAGRGCDRSGVDAPRGR